jgi:hypothetical protein
MMKTEYFKAQGYSAVFFYRFPFSHEKVFRQFSMESLQWLHDFTLLYLSFKFKKLLAFCCCWGPAFAYIPSVPGVSTFVSAPSVVGVPVIAGFSAVFNIYAVVWCSAVAGVLLASLLFLVFPLL